VECFEPLDAPAAFLFDSTLEYPGCPLEEFGRREKPEIA
jgi:hypothetical protein